RWVFQQRPSDCDPLALPPREPHAALAEEGIVALRQLAYECIGACGPGGRFNLCVARRRSTIADVLAGSGAEQNGFLGHNPDALADGLRIGLRDVDAVDQYAP